MTTAVEKATLEYYANAAKILRAPITLFLPNNEPIWVVDAECNSDETSQMA